MKRSAILTCSAPCRLAACCLLVVCSAAWGEETTWTLTGSGSWLGPSWSNGSPNSSTDAYINNGGTALIAGGSAHASSLYLGCSGGGAGNVAQTAGSAEMGALFLGVAAASSGTYNLSGSGSLNVAYLCIGEEGVGQFVQEGGTAWITTGVVGGVFGGDGHYELRSGQLSVGNQTIGNGGNGLFVHTGGSHAVSVLLTLGSAGGVTGTYQLGSSGALTADAETIGDAGIGRFEQTSGSHVVNTDLTIGNAPGGDGRYTLSGGSLSAGNLNIGIDGLGLLDIANYAADITVTGAVTIGQNASLSAVAGSRIKLTGTSFANRGADAAGLAGLSRLALAVSNGLASACAVEAAGRDLGSVRVGFLDNFALGALRVGQFGAGHARLVDDAGNLPGPDAVYAMTLRVFSGSVLDLNGRNLYYLTGEIDPGASVLNGAVIRVAALAGDTDLNGGVNFADYQKLEVAFGASGNWTEGDFNGDGLINFADYQKMEVNFGTSIPEPSALALVLLGGLGVLRLRR